MSLERPSVDSLPHTPPAGYFYTIRDHSARFWRVDLVHPPIYSYTSKVVSTIWGFLSKKTLQIYAPVNSKTPGKIIPSELTTPWSAMFPPKVSPLVKLFS